MSMFSRITGKASASSGPVKGLAAAFGLPQKKTRSPVRGRGRSRSNSRSPSGSRSGSSRSQSYSEDDDHSASPNRSARTGSRSRSRSRSRSQSRERQRPSSSSAPKKNRMVGVANPRAEAKLAQAKLEASKKKKAEVAAQARSIRANMSSTTGRQPSPGPKKRPSTATASSQKFSGTQPTSTFRQRAGSPPARPATAVTVPALPPCTCTNSACREEFRLVYSTLQAHLAAQATTAAAYAEIQRENSFLRKQLQLYRISGEARTYHETTLGMTAGAAALERAELARSASGLGFNRTASLSSPTNAAGPNGFAEDEEAARRRRMKERERERERRMEEAKQNVLERDGGEDTPYESRASTSAFSFAPAPSSAAVEENRFTLPSSPASRLRPFGGAGSERLDVNASPANLAGSLGRSGSSSGLTRQPSNSSGGSGNPGLTRQPSGGTSGPGLTRQPSNGPGLMRQPSGRERLQRTDDYEADDLVADLNRPISVQSDRRNGEPMGTQEFDIAYA